MQKGTGLGHAGVFIEGGNAPGGVVDAVVAGDLMLWTERVESPPWSSVLVAVCPAIMLTISSRASTQSLSMEVK